MTERACEKCGEPAPDRNHKDGNPGNNAPSNIAILCRRCHMVEDGRIERLAASAETCRRWNKRPAKEFCKRGHPLSGENLFLKGITRRCRICYLAYEQLPRIKEIRRVRSRKAYHANPGPVIERTIRNRKKKAFLLRELAAHD